jgi:lamin tail-like protein/putative Ig domain-containing protein
VFINEWMAQNTSTLADGVDGDFEDWIELYNAGTNTVDLSGYWMTDNLANHTQFKIPNGTLIPGGGYLLVWADGETGQNTTNRADIHASFQLSRTGEAIGLYAPDGITVIDEITFGSQTNDISQGRFPDAGPGPYPYMTQPTPRAANTLNGGGNTAPSLDPIADKYVVLGETLSFTAHGSDADAGQVLTYSASGTPAGASIGAASGIFTWTPSAGQTPSVNPVTVTVTDNGSPAKSASQSFTIYVSAAPGVAISRNGGDITLGFSTALGRHYQIQYKDQLSDATWANLGSIQIGTGAPLQVPDNIGARPQRFYRILVVAQ